VQAPDRVAGGSVTRLLRDWTRGDAAAGDRLLAVVYGELRSRAAAYLRHERADHTLQPTALVHEAYLRLFGQRRVSWQNRAHFYSIASNQMRRVLVDHARARLALKRPSSALRVELSEQPSAAIRHLIEVVSIDEALESLALEQPRQAKIVELRYFGGLSEREVAEHLSLSRATVTREWQTARVWLFERLKPGPVNTGAEPAT